MPLLEEAKFWPYRFKTREEFEEQYGSGDDWRFHDPETAFVDEMDYLLGKPLEAYFPDPMGFDDDEKDEITIPRRDEDIEYGDDDEEDDNVWFVKRSFLKKNDEPRIPNYTPRRIIRTLEKFENKYKYSFILVKVEDGEESKKIQELCFANEIFWAGGDKTPKFLDDDFPDFILIGLDDFWGSPNLSHSKSNILEIWKVTEKDIVEKIDPKIYAIKDYPTIKVLLEKGVISPNYTPRKIVRTLEARNSYSEANEIYMVVENKEELVIVKEKVYDIYGYSWLETLDNYITDIHYSNPYPIFIFINIKSRTFGYALRDNMTPFTDITQHHVFDGVLNKLFTIVDIDKIVKMMKTGEMIKEIPNYSPRRITRTLEKRNNIQEAEEICVLIRNVEEYDKFYNAVTELGYVITEVFDKMNRKMESPVNIFVNLKTGHISQSSDIHDYDRHWTDYSSFDGVWEKELTMDELPYIVDILKHGKIIPSYRPKKIVRRLDEEVNFDVLKFLPPKPPTLTPEEQKLRYKKGDIVIVRPDALDYFNDTVGDMEKFLGKEVEITDVETALGRYGEDGCDRRHMQPDDLLLTVVKHGDYRANGTWYWYYRCLVNPKFMMPTYQPRKINRTLENLNESPDWATYIDDNDRAEVLKWDLSGAFAFGYYKDKMYLSPETKGHGSMGPDDERRVKMFDRNDFTFPGRLWKNQKLISFWIYPNKEEFKKVLIDLSEITDIDFNDGWKVEMINNSNQSKNIPISEYEGSEQRTAQELASQHIKSPLLKQKIVPQGWGSTSPRYSSNRKWQMASMSDESVLYESKMWYDEFKRRQAAIINGPYDVIFIYAPTQEDKMKLKLFLIRIQIVGSLEDLDKEELQDFFIVIKKGALETFRIDGFTEPDSIRDRFIHHLPEFNRLSPTMTVDRFIGWMTPFVQEARNMYKPRKIDRTVESIDNDRDKEQAKLSLKDSPYDVIVFRNNGPEDFEKFKKLMEEYPYFIYGDKDTGEPMDYYLTLRNTDDHWEQFMVYCDKHEYFDGIIPGDYRHTKFYKTPIGSVEELNTVLKKLINPKPDYSPRKINRTLESVSNQYPYEYIILKINSREDIDRINNELKTISPKLCNDFPWDIEYPNVVMIRPQKSADDEYQCMQAWSDRNDMEGIMYYMERNNHSVDSNIYSMEDLKKIKMMIQYGNVVPSYTPRRIDRTI